MLIQIFLDGGCDSGLMFLVFLPATEGGSRKSVYLDVFCREKMVHGSAPW